MLTMAIARSAGEAQNNHVGLETPDGPHHIAENFFTRPLRAQRFIGGFGKSKVDGAREKLLCAVDTPRGE